MQSQGQSFPRSARLLSQHDFKQVFDNNSRRASSRFALLLALNTSGESSRLGLVVAKKNVKLAAQRNRVKRQVREFFRLNPPRQSWDLVFIARRGLGELSNQQIRAMLDDLWRKLNNRRIGP